MPTAEGNAPSAVEIELVDGRNCWERRCFYLSRKNRSVAVSGRFPVRVPSNIDIRGGLVSPEEFNAMFRDAMLALSRGAGQR